ncbi:MAG TPA: PIN domain-containing protein [Methylomirabilota bacterium]|nr:PIN domain-containing protein [Methylomirabilota bacterium]
MKVFLDTGAFLALADEDAEYHAAASSVYTKLIQSRARLVTSNFILSETYTVIRSRVSHRAAVDFIKHFDHAGISVLRVGQAIEQTAKEIFIRYDDKNFSVVDCTSFALIGHHGFDHAFAFDVHFNQYRFKRTVSILPGRPQ